MLVLAVVAVAVMLVAGSTRLGDAVIRRQRAQVIADVAALAGAAQDDRAASRVARHNGAQVVRSLTGADGSFALTVAHGGIRASAAATRG